MISYIVLFTILSGFNLFQNILRELKMSSVAYIENRKKILFRTNNIMSCLKKKKKKNKVYSFHSRIYIDGRCK